MPSTRCLNSPCILQFAVFVTALLKSLPLGVLAGLGAFSASLDATTEVSNLYICGDLGDLLYDLFAKVKRQQ